MEKDEATPNPLPPWVELEYTHMKMLAGASARVLFTHLSQRSCASLQDKLASLTGPVASSEIYTRSILELLNDQDIPLSNVCLLDPKAERKLEPEDGLEFEWFLFGVFVFLLFKSRFIITARKPGDDPPRDRTSQLRQLGFPTRHLGPVQMTTDTAVGVTKRVVDDKGKHRVVMAFLLKLMRHICIALTPHPEAVPLDEIPYVEFPTIRFNAKESVEMPFKYIADQPGGEPLLPPGMKELLYEDLNKGFDF